MSNGTEGRLELFSNEFLLEVFDYLAAYSLSAAFDGLKQRFIRLIRSCPMHLTFEETLNDQRM